MSVHIKSRIPQIIATAEAKVARANRETADRIAEEARDQVERRSGDLEGDIEVVAVGDDFYVRAGNRSSFYGHFLEYGTAQAAPRPFLLPAADAARDGHLEAISEAYG